MYDLWLAELHCGRFSQGTSISTHSSYFTDCSTFIYPFIADKEGERERQRRESGVVGDITFKGKTRNHFCFFTVLKVPKQRLLALLTDVRLRQDTAPGREESEDLGRGHCYKQERT